MLLFFALAAELVEDGRSSQLGRPVREIFSYIEGYGTDSSIQVWAIWVRSALESAEK